MNKKETENKKIEELLRKAHLPGPSPRLQERITNEAKKAWNQTEAELPWLIPFSRLVASAAAAIVIIWLADYYSESRMAQWQNVKFTVSSEQSSVVEALKEISYSPFIRHFIVLNRRSSVIDTSALNDRLEALRQILDETLPSNTTKPSVPQGDRSSLVPIQQNTVSYS